MQTVDFFNLPLVATTPRELPQLLASWMEQGSWLVTVNAEMMLRAKRQPEYAQLLRQADVLLPDGFGLVLWSRGLIEYRFPGVELTAQVLDRAQSQQLKVVCLVAKSGLSTAVEVQASIQRQWSQLLITAVDCDPQTEVESQTIVLKEAQVVLVNFGVPQQDEWLAKMKREAPNFKIGIGVGGTFEYWTGKRKRAPAIMRLLGLESVWRLLTQPWRTLRVWNAVVAFSWNALWHAPVASAR